MRDLSQVSVTNFKKHNPGNDVYHATVGPQDALILPVGWIVAERINARSDTYGLKSALLRPSDQEDFEKWDKLWIAQQAQDPVLQGVIDVLTLLSG